MVRESSIDVNIRNERRLQAPVLKEETDKQIIKHKILSGMKWELHRMSNNIVNNVLRAKNNT